MPQVWQPFPSLQYQGVGSTYSKHLDTLETENVHKKIQYQSDLLVNNINSSQKPQCVTIRNRQLLSNQNIRITLRKKVIAIQ